MVSFFGTMITAVAVPYQVFQLTHSSLAVGLIGLFELATILGFAFLGGAIADANDRRRMVLLTEAGMAMASVLLIANALLPHPQLWVIYGLAMAVGALDAIQRPSLDAMLPRLVERDELTAAGAISALRTNVGMIVGPALAGVLIALVGLPLTYAVDVVTFLFSLVCLGLMNAVPPAIDAGRVSLRGIVEGLRYAASRQELIGTYVVDMVAMFFGMPIALFPAIAASHGGPAVLGLLFTAPAVGSGIAFATSGWASRVHRHGRAVIVAALLWGVAITAFGLAENLVLVLLFLAAAGAADGISGVFRSTIWNQTIPDRLRGRLAGIEMVSYTSGPLLGNAESGLVAQLFSVRVSIVSGGLLCVAGCLLMAALLPRFRAYDSRDGVRTAPADGI